MAKDEKVEGENVRAMIGHFEVGDLRHDKLLTGRRPLTRHWLWSGHGGTWDMNKTVEHAAKVQL